MLEKIIDYTNIVFKLDIRNQTRKREYVEARAFYYELARKITIHSLAEIGKPLGKDHATVIHGLRNVTCFLDEKKLQKAFVDFQSFDKKDTKSYSYIYYQNKELQMELNKKNAVLSLMPKLEAIYEKMNVDDEVISDRVKKKSEYYLERAGDYINELYNKI